MDKVEDSRSKSYRELSYSEFRNTFSMTMVAVALQVSMRLGLLAPHSDSLVS
jgi:hypothetical protein